MLYTYISHSRIPKTYYGVTFNYGDKKEVSGVINDKRFVFCCSRQTSDIPAAPQTVEVESPKPAVASAKPVSESIPQAKPKSARGRKPKFVEAIVDEPALAEEPTSTDAE